MTIDERAAACAEEVIGLPRKESSAIIARYICGAVAERDALLRECVGLFGLGKDRVVLHLDGMPESAMQCELDANKIHARITAMIGE